MVTSLATLTDLVLPRRCVGCGEPAVALCLRCTGEQSAFRVDCEGVDVWAAAAYDAMLRRAVIAYKERGRRDLTRPLTALLGGALRALGPPPGTMLITPPTSRAVAASRGGDHMLRLAAAAATGTRLHPRAGVLSPTRRVRDSAGLGVEARERNLSGSMRARRPSVSSRRDAVLVDDVITTGATVREAVRALRESGWTVHGAAVVAATPKRFRAYPLAAPG